MPDTIIESGYFTSTSLAKTIQLRESVDWMTVTNYTNWAAVANEGLRFTWQRGMAAGTGLAERLTAGVWTPYALANPAGFTFVDSSLINQSSAVALTAISAANPPVVTSALSVQVGDIVRMSNLDHQFNIAGMDFTVTAINAGVSFTIGNISLLNSTAATDGTARKISFDPYYYPRRRFVTFVRNSALAVIYMSVTHGYTVGQEVTLEFPGGARVWGDYAQMHGKTVTILGVGATRTGNEPNNAGTANSITVDFDASGFTSWETSFGAANDERYPEDALYPISQANVVPVGEDTATALGLNQLVVPQIASGNILADATYNTAFIGMVLGTSANPELTPSGTTGDVMYWVAGKSFATQPSS